jgi:hypothetical protein
MAEDVSILQEIDEALRADKASQFWERNSGTIITFCVLLVLSTAASAFWKSHQREAHASQTGKLMEAIMLLDEGKGPEATALFGQVEHDGGPLAAFASIKDAQTYLRMNQFDKAIEAYNAVASGKQGDTPDVLRDYAALQADILAHNQAMFSGKPAVATLGGQEARGAGRPFAGALSELDALRTTDAKSASALLGAIVADKDVPLSQRMRATQLLETLVIPAMTAPATGAPVK